MEKHCTTKAADALISPQNRFSYLQATDRGQTRSSGEEIQTNSHELKRSLLQKHLDDGNRG